jgi:thiaminase
MTYIEAVEIEMELSVNWQYSDITEQTKENIFREWFKKHGYKKIKECIETLCKDLDKKRDTYMHILKIARIMNGGL